MKYPFHSRSCPVQPVPISVVGTKMESGWGKWATGLRRWCSASSSLLSFTLILFQIPSLSFELKNISGWELDRDRLGSGCNWLHPPYHPAYPGARLKWVSRRRWTQGRRRGVVVHCGGGHLLICCSITTLSPVVHLDWFPNNNIFLWYSILIFIRYSCSIRNIFFIKVSTEGDSGFY